MSMHEEIPELDARGLREFGLVTAGIVAGLFGLALPFLLGLNYPRWPWIIAAVLTAWALVAPATLKHPYHWWMRLGMAIGWVMNRVVLSIVFFLVLFPLGAVMKIRGWDPMARKLSREQDSYRVPSKATKPDQMNRPY